jgi:hypothetical protein
MVKRLGRIMGVPLWLAVLLPLVFVPEGGGWAAKLVGVISWLVFVVDHVVDERLLATGASTWWCRFDLAVVVLTKPWHL